MKTIDLIIKQKWFDAILSGEKKEEFREIRPNTMKKYCQVDEEGFVIEKDEVLQPVHYDAIRFFVGYAKDRASAIVEIKDTRIELFEDEDTHELITYTHEGEEYVASQVVFTLGRVIN